MLPGQVAELLREVEHPDLTFPPDPPWVHKASNWFVLLQLATTWPEPLRTSPGLFLHLAALGHWCDSGALGEYSCTDAGVVPNQRGREFDTDNRMVLHRLPGNWDSLQHG